MLSAFVIAATLVQSPEQALRDIERSHIEANVPPAAEFDRLLSRDLTNHLAELKGYDVRVEYSPLRDGPTQSGTSYPKFYLWVRVFRGTTAIQEGAVRVAAVDRKSFDVTDYVPEQAIRADPEGLYRIFPAPVTEKIKARLRLK